MPTLLDTPADPVAATTPAADPAVTAQLPADPMVDAATRLFPDPAKPADPVVTDPAKPAEPAAETPEAKAAREATEAEALKNETPEQKAEREAKEKAEADKAKGAPETYEDFKLPEGVALDADAAKTFAEIAKADNLTQDQAQKYIDLAAKMQQDAAKSFATAQIENFNKLQTGWRAEITGDKEFGGANLTASVASAQKAINTFGDAELKGLLSEGLGDHPAVIRAFARIGRGMSEDSIVRGGKPAAGDAASVMYPTLSK